MSESYQQVKAHYQTLLSQHYTWLFLNGRDPLKDVYLFKDPLNMDLSRVKRILDLGRYLMVEKEVSFCTFSSVPVGKRKQPKVF
jgi:hypothetical protein